jgi:hypothetical protein
LTAAGDSAAVVPGWTFVGKDSGNYVQEATGIFAFVGNNQGDYTVSFSFFGANNGDYRNIGLGRYEYVGENLGSYRPFIILPQARRHDVVGFNLDLAPHSSLTLSSEMAISQFDRNLFSSADDGDNSGAAYSLNLNFRPSKLLLAGRDLGRLDLRGRLRSKSASFRDIDRTTQVEFNRKWNLSNDQAHTENIGELSASYSPITDLKLSGGLGRLSQSDALSSNRWEAHASMNRANLPRFDYFVEKIERRDHSLQSSSWLRHRGHAGYDLKVIKPLIDFEGEIREDATGDSSQTGFRYESVTGGFQLSPWRSTMASFSYNYRNDKQRVGGAFLPKSIARTQFYSWSLRNWHSISATASYTHRTRDFADITVQDTRTDLADLRLGYSPRTGGVRTNVYYQISNTQIAKQEEVFLEVKDGEGNFRFNEELNEFEPDPFGNFVRQVIATNDFIPVVELRFRTDLRLTPKRLFGADKKGRSPGVLERLLSPLTMESFIRIDERTKEKDVEKIYLMKLSHFQQDSTTIFGSMEVRQDIHLWENSRRLSLRYRLRNRKEKNNQFVGGGQDRDVLQHQFRILNRFSNQVTARLDYINSSEDRVFESIGREDRQVRSHEFELDFVYRPERKLEFALKSELSLNRDIVQSPATKANLISFAPRSSYSLSKKGRFRGEIDWTKVFVAPKSRLIPFELTGGNRAGATLRWNFGLEYRMAQNVQASFSYFGRSEPDRPKAQHFAKVEMRAFF